MLDENNILRACKDPVFLEKFWARVVKADGCWSWSGSFFSTGYGLVSMPSWCKKKMMTAHRISWIVSNGHAAIPDGAFVLHSCDNPPCVNPAHLSLGTPADNLRQAAERNRMPKGEANGNSKLTAEKVRELRRRYPHERKDLLAIEFGISRRTLTQIQRRDTWKGIE